MEVKECSDLAEEVSSSTGNKVWLVNIDSFFDRHDVFQNQFIVDDVSKIIKEAIENSIGGTAYQHNKVNQWTSAVVESCLGQLTKLQKPYKYIGKLKVPQVRRTTYMFIGV